VHIRNDLLIPDMHILYFAVRQHHMRYFTKLASHPGPDSQEVTRHKYSFIPDFPVLSASSRKRIQSAVRMKLREHRQSHTQYWLSAPTYTMLLVLYTIWGYWLYLCYRHTLKQKRADAVIMWSGLMWHQQLCHAAATELGLQCLFMENGPLPDTTVIDPKGVNYLNSVPRESSFYQGLDTTKDIRLPDQLVVREKHKRKPLHDVPSVLTDLPEKYVFVPFQVDTDRQVICYSPWIKNMPDLYQTLVRASDSLPEGYVFLVKEHPSCKKEYSCFHNLHAKVLFANNFSTQTLIEGSHAVLTINSSVGLESLLFNKYVITVGQAFYNIPGVVDTAESFSELIKILKEISLEKQKNRLTKIFLNYLYFHYLIKGDWRQASMEHLDSASNRIQELLHGQ
jgi:capsular polysaccharide export protein